MDHVIEGHNGCVNTVQWNANGRTLVSSGDDLAIKLWDTHAGYQGVLSIPSGHTGNIFSAKFLPWSNDVTLVSCARDGAVRLHDVETATTLRAMGKYDYTVHKLAFVDRYPHVVLACCEDGTVRLFDTRCDVNLSSESIANVVVDMRGPSSRTNLELHTLAVHGNTLACAGCDPNLRFYDLRRPARPDHASPRLAQCTARAAADVPRHRWKEPRITGIAFDVTGCRLAASYMCYDVVIFDTTNAVVREGEPLMELEAPPSIVEWTSSDAIPSSLPSADTAPSITPEELQAVRVGHRMRHFAARLGTGRSNSLTEDESKARRTEGDTERCPVGVSLKGHANIETIKEVTFHGVDSEYVCSGSDCGSIFVWSSRTGEVVNVLRNADQRTVNCIATNPQNVYTIATSGIDNTVKIWSPAGPQGESDRSHDEEIRQRNEQRRTDQSLRMTPSQMYSFLLLMRLQQQRANNNASQQGQQEVAGDDFDPMGSSEDDD
jgi:WD repeat-containing protein 42A